MALTQVIRATLPTPGIGDGERDCSASGVGRHADAGGKPLGARMHPCLAPGVLQRPVLRVLAVAGCHGKPATHGQQQQRCVVDDIDRAADFRQREPCRHTHRVDRPMVQAVVDTLDDSFPASDPPAWTLGRSTR